jgi:hypothetical protein
VAVKVNVAALASLFAPNVKLKAVQTEATADFVVEIVHKN